MSSDMRSVPDLKVYVSRSLTSVRDYVCISVSVAVKVVRDSSSGQYVKISSTRVVRTTTASLINDSVIDVRRVDTSDVCRLG